MTQGLSPQIASEALKSISEAKCEADICRDHICHLKWMSGKSLALKLGVLTWCWWLNFCACCYEPCVSKTKQHPSPFQEYEREYAAEMSMVIRGRKLSDQGLRQERSSTLYIGVCLAAIDNSQQCVRLRQQHTYTHYYCSSPRC